MHFRSCKNYLKKKPWVQPLAVAGSHVETEEKENISENKPEKSKAYNIVYKNVYVQTKYERYKINIFDD